MGNWCCTQVHLDPDELTALVKPPRQLLDGWFLLKQRPTVLKAFSTMPTTTGNLRSRTVTVRFNYPMMPRTIDAWTNGDTPITIVFASQLPVAMELIETQMGVTPREIAELRQMAREFMANGTMPRSSTVSEPLLA